MISQVLFVTFEMPPAFTKFSGKWSVVLVSVERAQIYYAFVMNLQFQAYSKLSLCLGNEITHLKCSLHVSSNAPGIITYACV